jgi:hypothetical protein
VTGGATCSVSITTWSRKTSPSALALSISQFNGRCASGSLAYPPPDLLIDDVPGEVEHVLGDFDVLDVVEILVRIAHFVRVDDRNC